MDRTAAIAHLVNIARLAGLEIVQVRPVVEGSDVEVWVALPSGNLGGLLAREFARDGFSVRFGFIGEEHEQKEIANVLGERLRSLLSRGGSVSTFGEVAAQAINANDVEGCWFVRGIADALDGLTPEAPSGYAADYRAGFACVG